LKIPLDKILRKAYIHNMKILISGVIGTTVIGFALGFNACENPFQTRTPEPPARVQSTFSLPHAPGIVFINLRYALAERNVVNYERCFSDSLRSGRSFRFIPEKAVAATNPNVFDNWDLKEERDYFVRMVAPDSLFSLRLDSLEAKPILKDTVVYRQRYDLIARHQRPRAPRRVAGEGLFFLRRDDFGDWSIYRWEDSFDRDSSSTWSTLKVAFAQ
jgi:hypothetical protein